MVVVLVNSYHRCVWTLLLHFIDLPFIHSEEVDSVGLMGQEVALPPQTQQCLLRASVQNFLQSSFSAPLSVFFPLGRSQISQLSERLCLVCVFGSALEIRAGESSPLFVYLIQIWRNVFYISEYRGNAISAAVVFVMVSAVIVSADPESAAAVRRGCFPACAALT